MVVVRRPLVDSDEGYEEDIDPNTEGIGAGAFYVQRSGIPLDDAVGLGRDALDNLILKDAALPNGVTLASRVGIVDFLLAVPPVNPAVVYTPMYATGLIVQEDWTVGGVLLRREAYSYASGRVSTRVVRVYDSDGLTVLGQVSWSYSYTSGRLSSSNMTRDV